MKLKFLELRHIFDVHRLRQFVSRINRIRNFPSSSLFIDCVLFKLMKKTLIFSFIFMSRIAYDTDFLVSLAVNVALSKQP